jgi:hypothetical protein
LNPRYALPPKTRRVIEISPLEIGLGIGIAGFRIGDMRSPPSRRIKGSSCVAKEWRGRGSVGKPTKCPGRTFIRNGPTYCAGVGENVNPFLLYRVEVAIGARKARLDPSNVYPMRVRPLKYLAAEPWRQLQACWRGRGSPDKESMFATYGGRMLSPLVVPIVGLARFLNFLVGLQCPVHEVLHWLE